jgi:cobyrinic acid a,c-diamide synthase
VRLPLPRLAVAAPARGTGKSTVSIGLAAALRARGLAVAPFKKGPDFIDPMWLAAAAGRPCRNLDFFFAGPERIAAAFAARAAGADLALVELNHGLHDGPDPEGADSGAALARLLAAPVLLVVGARGLGRGVAALVQGQVAFDPAVRFAGVVLNRVRGGRHESKLRDAVERYCGLPVLGALPERGELAIAERHLGLTPLAEAPALEPIVARVGEAAAAALDLDAILAAARGAAPFAAPEAAPPPAAAPGRRVRLGIAADRAFTFYYPENLEALRAAGADLVPFSPLADPRLPPVEGLYLGGGFPEVHMEALEANRGLREELRRAVAAGLPVWAECGGLMYLAREIRWGGRRAAMAGALPCAVEMEDRPAGHGYALVEATGAVPWLPAGLRLRGHEFHHSHVADLAPGTTFGLRVLRGSGVAAGCDGIVAGNCVAGYTHLHADGAPDWAPRFVDFIRRRA